MAWDSEIPDGALELLKKYEGLVLNFYHCTSNVLTVGYGHAVLKNEIYGKDLKSEDILKISKILKENTLHPKGANMILKAVYGDVISQEQADKLLLVDAEKHWNEAKKHIKVPLNASQRIALISFVFNIGVTDFISSTLLKKVNAKNFQGASKEFSKWVFSGGKVNNGLKKRRANESEIFAMKIL